MWWIIGGVAVIGTAFVWGIVRIGVKADQDWGAFWASREYDDGSER